jgi:DNA recombination protein RmuC
MARNALEVQALGQELYERLATMGGHLERLGRSLERTVGSYNDLVGSTESRVLVTARRFPGLGVVGDGAREIPSAVPVDVIPRLISATELTTTDPRMDHPAGLGHEPLHVVDDES